MERNDPQNMKRTLKNMLNEEEEEYDEGIGKGRNGKSPAGKFVEIWRPTIAESITPTNQTK